MLVCKIQVSCVSLISYRSQDSNLLLVYHLILTSEYGSQYGRETKRAKVGDGIKLNW